MSDLLVVAGWLGPNKMFNTAQGQSYVFGVLTITQERLSYAASDGTLVFDAARTEATVEFPFWLLGGSRVKTPAGAWIVAFGKPFPDAPPPNDEALHRAATTLERVHQRSAAELVQALVVPDAELSDTKQGRKIGGLVKATLNA